ncbi:hypothetical protein GQR58_017567 [Nymphon striatum]|nr:hypothetical protein GQR58_017567 [Nymphon striatum]
MNFKSLIILAVVICQAYAILHGAVLGAGVKALAGAAILKFAKFALSKNDKSGFNSGFGGNKYGHGFGNGHHGYYGGQSYEQGPREYKNEVYSSKTYAVDGGYANSIHHGPYGHHGSYGHGAYGYPVAYGSYQFGGNVPQEYTGGKSLKKMNFKSLIILAVVICQAYAVFHGAVLGVGVKALAGAAILKFANFALSKNHKSGFNSGFGGKKYGHGFGNGYYSGPSYEQGPREYKNEVHSSKTYAVDGGYTNSIHHEPYGYGGYGYGSYGHGDHGYYGGPSYEQGPREYKNEVHSSKTYAVDGGYANSIHHEPYGYGSYGHGVYGYPHHADTTFFPNVRELLSILAVLPLGSCGAERSLFLCAAYSTHGFGHLCPQIDYQTFV